MEKTSMTETKYGKYIITKGDKPENAPEADFKSLLYLDDTVLPGALYTECAWLREPSTKSPPAHAHDFDEVLGFIGTDPANPQDLCGEVELWLGDERHILTKTCVVFAPRGLMHCPVNTLRADRPIFMFTTGPATGAYNHS
jgi:hypothetical protein